MQHFDPQGLLTSASAVSLSSTSVALPTWVKMPPWFPHSDVTAHRPDPFTVADGNLRLQTSKKFVSGCSTGFGLLEVIVFLY
jgi:hypothetical protein